ncbi:MAG: CRTAC1 family protein, partial [Planctomycetota bacterium]
ARILVANDTTPNQLLIPEHDAETGMLFRDLGFGSGIALNEDGKSEGCMGIAVADLNGDGLHEFLVTNFLAETNTLYWQSSPDSFEDRTRDLHLNVASNDVLGFGTQFLDADLDGLAELFVANGHVDDLRDSGKPFRMPPQMFRWDGRRFALGDSLIQGPYFQTDWLGRAAARIDWNRDGLNDLVVAHLDDEYALLTNTTSPFGNFISLKLIGVESNRDAIGATVRVRSLQRVQFQQITAGDGYQCSNERQLTFGLGDASEAQSVEVVWPSGRRQRFESIPTSRRYLLLEGSELITDP